MRYTVTTSYVDVVGSIWQPGFDNCAMRYTLDGYALGNIAGYKQELGLDWRAAVEHWVALNSGDFQSVRDFSADLETDEGNVVLPWADGESELVYNDAMYGEED